MVKDAVDYVGDRLETAVGMPRGAFRLAGGVVHLAHLVHVHERVDPRHRHPGEGPVDGEALAFHA